MRIAIRFLALALASLSMARACECSDPTVQDAKQRATVIFHGTITALRSTDKRSPMGIDTGKVATFRVARVWKGEVGPVFEMPAVVAGGDCWGFSDRLLKVASDLIVYAVRIEGMYYTTLCSRTQFVKFATKDLEELVVGELPKTSSVRSTSK